MLRLTTDGIDCRFSNTGIGSVIIVAVMDNIYYEDNSRTAKIKRGDETLLEIKAEYENETLGFNVAGHWYCLPDAEDVVTDYVCSLLE